jgi:hypothetical protein
VDGVPIKPITVQALEECLAPYRDASSIFE